MQISLGYRYSALDKRPEFFIYSDSIEKITMYNWFWFYLGKSLGNIESDIYPYPDSNPKMKVLKTCKLSKPNIQAKQFADLIKNKLDL